MQQSSPTSICPSFDFVSFSWTHNVNIISVSRDTFNCGSFLTCYKTAQTTALLNQQGLGETELWNYRSVSNPSTTSKILEWLVLACLSYFVSTASSLDPNAAKVLAMTPNRNWIIKIYDPYLWRFQLYKSMIIIALDQQATFYHIDNKTHNGPQTFGVTCQALNFWRRI